VVGIWLGLALTTAMQGSLAHGQGDPTPFAPRLFDAIIDWGSCAVFTPLAVWLVARFPVMKQPLRHAPLQLAAVAGLVIAKFALQYAVLTVVGKPPAAAFGDTLVRRFFGEAILFAALFAVIHAALLYDRLRTQELQALTLRAELADSRLDALVGKIEPHFLFNTLQAISTLLHRDPRAADAMLSGLSELLRELLRSDAAREIPLSVELETARRYLDLMAIRFGDRLVVAIDVPAELDGAMVPRLVLQPLLENALRHGVACTVGPARLELAARRIADRIEVTVADDGRGDHAATAGNGVGLANTRERLHRLYGDAGRLDTVKPPGGGFRVTLQLPLRQRAEPA
jgi:signal transduction histidine kinase